MEYPSELCETVLLPRVPFVDPVKLVANGKTYEREALTSFFEKLRARNKPLHEPGLPSKPVDDVTTVDDTVMLEKIATFRKEAADSRLRERKTVSVYNMGSCLQKLDGFNDLLQNTFEGWEPPHIILLGPEQTGKSTVLERLTMMPIFPRGLNPDFREITTLMAVHVHLKRSDKTQVRIRVMCQEPGSKEFSVEEQCIQMDWIEAEQEIGNHMREICKHPENLKAVCRDKIIEISISHPHVPSINLIDLPGFVSNRGEFRSPTIIEDIHNLALWHVEKYKKNAIFLCIHSGREEPSQNAAFHLVHEKKLQRQTLGVLTFCDQVKFTDTERENTINAAKIRHFTNINDAVQDPTANKDILKLYPHGYVAVANQPSGNPTGPRTEEVLKIIEKEHNFFVTNHMADLIEQKRATSDSLGQKVDDIFGAYLTETWIPKTLKLVSEDLECTARELVKLGTPEFKLNDFNPKTSMTKSGREENRDSFLRHLQQEIKKAFWTARVKTIHEFALKKLDEYVAFMQLFEVKTPSASSRKHVNGVMVVCKENYVDAVEFVSRLKIGLEECIFGKIERKFVNGALVEEQVPGVGAQLLELWLEPSSDMLSVLTASDGAFHIRRFEKFLAALNQRFTVIVRKVVESSVLAGKRVLDALFARPSPHINFTAPDKDAVAGGLTLTGIMSTTVTISLNILKFANEVLAEVIGESTSAIRVELDRCLYSTFKEKPSSVSASTNNAPSRTHWIELDDTDIITEIASVADARVSFGKRRAKLEHIRAFMLDTIFDSAIVALRNRELLHPLYKLVLTQYAQLFAGGYVPKALDKVLLKMQFTPTEPLDATETILLEEYRSNIFLKFVVNHAAVDTNPSLQHHALLCVRVHEPLRACGTANPDWSTLFSEYIKAIPATGERGLNEDLLHLLSAGIPLSSDQLKDVQTSIEHVASKASTHIRPAATEQDQSKIHGYQQFVMHCDKLLAFFSENTSCLLNHIGVFSSQSQKQYEFNVLDVPPTEKWHIFEQLCAKTIQTALKLLKEREAKAKLIRSDCFTVFNVDLAKLITATEAGEDGNGSGTTTPEPSVTSPSPTSSRGGRRTDTTNPSDDGSEPATPQTNGGDGGAYEHKDSA